ncbi:MAG TPA: sn-glycerol-3-phosphate ABC transporter ATP-binding protein UgpC [Campylobacterales bacterium]|nr:sn-glycerol-3-phosphate ABC transporter ATP-binding protein UgpC [Campylobacterales bacterium]
MSYIDIENIIKSYSSREQIIKSLSLAVQKGEFLVIVGPSGCGKSTLLRMIAGLEDIDDGVIKIEDKVINKISPADRDIAMVFQNYALYPHMNVYKNLSYGLKNRKVPKSVIEQKVQEIASLLQIEDLLFRKPSELSGGQRQRVAMGRAIIREPKVFLFDEPLSNLDAKLRQQMRLEIRKLHKKLNITSIYVTHDQIEAMTLADRIVVMNKGSIEQVGTPHEIYNNPQTLFVSKFMGTPPMNIFLSKIVDDSIDFFGNLIKLNSKIDDDEVYVGIRAEDISLHEGKDTIKLHIKIELIERLGRENLIYTTIDGSQLTLKTNDSINENLSSVDIYIDRKNFYFFDKRDKKQISRLVE